MIIEVLSCSYIHSLFQFPCHTCTFVLIIITVDDAPSCKSPECLQRQGCTHFITHTCPDRCTRTHTFVFQSWTHSTWVTIALFQSSMSHTLSFPVFKVQRGLYLSSSQQIPVPGNKLVLCINSNAIHLTVWTEHLIAVTSYIKHVFFSFTHTIKTTHILQLHSKQIMH